MYGAKKILRRPDPMDGGVSETISLLPWMSGAGRISG
jgi:hypothetical protein